jgi:hypothetical protein
MRIHVFVLDGDGCLYNYVYFYLLRAFISQFANEIMQCEASCYAQLTNEQVAKMQQWIKDYDFKTEVTEHDYITQKYRKHLSNFLDFNTELTEDEEARYRSKATVNAINDCITILNNVDHTLLSEIALRANSKLLAYMKAKIKDPDITHVLFAVGSNRQSKYLDVLAMKTNGTGSIYSDNEYMTQHFQQLFKDKKIASNRFTLADVCGRLERGVSYEKILSGDGRFNRHADSIFDETKLSIMYGINHDVYAFFQQDFNLTDVNKENIEISMDFFDDLPEIMNALKESLQNHPDLLLNKSQLSLIPYDGNIANDSETPLEPSATVIGTGQHDPYYHKNIRLLAKSCRHNLYDFERPVNVAKTVDLKQFLESRYTGDPKVKLAETRLPLFNEIKKEEGKSTTARLSFR